MDFTDAVRIVITYYYVTGDKVMGRPLAELTKIFLMKGLLGIGLG